MKNIIRLFLPICLTVSSCSKEPDYQQDIAKNWSIEEYYISAIGDVLRTTVYHSIRFEIDEGGNFRQYWHSDTIPPNPVVGTWSVSGSVLYLDFAESSSPTNALCGNTSGIVEEYDILELSENRLTLSGICNQRSVEIEASR